MFAMRRVVKGVLNSPSKTFVAIALIFGSLLILVTPPFTGADEEAHFTRAYSITTGHLALHNTTQVAVPKSFRQTIGCFQTKTNQPGTMYRYNYANYGINKRLSYTCAMNLPLKQNDTEKVHTSAYVYSPIAYIPQTIAILAGRLLRAPIIIMAYMVRFSVLIEYIVMIALAIKLLPIRRWALTGIALLPTPIMFINNPSGDFILFGAAALMSAIIVRSIHIPRAQLDREQRSLTFGLAAISVIAVLSKGIFPGVCLLLLIPFFGGLHYRQYSKIAILAAAIGVGLLWQRLGVSLASSVNPASIFAFPKAFVKTMLYRWVDTDFIYMGDYVGNIPSTGEHLGMPSVIVSLINILFAAYIFIGYPEKSRLQTTGRQALSLQLAAICCAAAIVIGSFAALFVGVPYLQNTGTIRGVQARYLYPAFFVLAAMPLAYKVSTSEKTMARIVALGSAITLTTLTLVNLIYYHWV